VAVASSSSSMRRYSLINHRSPVSPMKLDVKMEMMIVGITTSTLLLPLRSIDDDDDDDDKRSSCVSTFVATNDIFINSSTNDEGIAPASRSRWKSIGSSDVLVATDDDDDDDDDDDCWVDDLLEWS